MRRSLSKPSRKNYTCKLNENAVDYSEVFVDNPPGKVDDFKCHTADLISMDCEFTKLKNFITILYSLEHRVNENPLEKLLLKGDMNRKYLLGEKLNISRKNLPNQVYYFNLTSRNAKNQTTSQNFQFNLLDSVKPREPVGVVARNVTARNASLFLTIPKFLIDVREYLEFDVKIRSEFDPKGVWKNVTFTQFMIDSKGKVVLNLSDLEFPAAVHNVMVQVKTKSSKYWSPKTNIGFKTKPEIPAISPEICSNCFHLTDSNQLYIYWKPVPKKFHFGSKFQYHLFLTERGGNFNVNLTLDKTWHHVEYEKFNGSLLIELHSRNILGTSREKSVLEIPKLSEIRANQQGERVKIKKELLSKSHYRISWKLPDLSNVLGFTILWCRTKNEKLPNQCDGSVNFTELEAHQRELSIDLMESVNFAVGVNYLDKNVGLEWAYCTVAKSDGNNNFILYFFLIKLQ
jgi:hypothetical protein